MKLKQRIDFWIWGSEMFEAVKLDMYLSSFEKGLPLENPPITGEMVWEVGRVRDKLISDKFLEAYGSNSCKITSSGVLHLAKGGYVSEYKQHKLSRWSIVLSLIATILSVVAIILSL